MRISENDSGFFSHADAESEVGKTLIEYIQTRYVKQITIQELSDLVFLSPNHVIRVFKKETGETPYQYLKITRLNNACDLLLYTNHSIKKIAEEK